MIHVLGLTARAERVLADAGITTVDELCERTPLDLRRLLGFGAGCLAEVETALGLLGRSLRGQPVPAAALEEALAVRDRLRERLAGAEAEVVRLALLRTAGDRKAAAELLGVSRAALDRAATAPRLRRARAAR